MKESSLQERAAAALKIRPGAMTSPLWSCERHEQLCFASAETTLCVRSGEANAGSEPSARQWIDPA